MIKFKTGICPLCGPNSKPQPLYAKGLCSNHYWYKNTQEKLSKKNSQKSLVNQKLNQSGLTLLQEYYVYHIDHAKGRCENCGEPLTYPNEKIAISCQAHIVPKEYFQSVEANIYNHLELGGLYQKCACHGQYDTNWMNAEKMPVFELAKTRFLLFKNDIARSELKRLPECFLKLF
jgi:hypothetical protein